MSVKLTPQELNLVVAGVKTLYSSVDKTSGEARYYADIYARLTEQEELDEIAQNFVTQFTDRLLESVRKVKYDGISSTEARLRAEVIEEIYVGIKDKVNGKK